MSNSLVTLRSRTSRTAHINGQPIEVEARETVLTAALRSGIEFPNSCRVGGCGACKCRLASGQVTELTETGYLLSAEELDAGYILACQSVPRSDIAIEVELAPSASATGRVLAQTKLTHDIVELRVQLDRPLPYQPGQFANVSIEGLDGVQRSYSFAAPANDHNEVTFFVRKIGNGQFSSLVNDEDVVGRTVKLDGPHGDFWLRPDSTPLLLIAGGSGLAPILAILRDAEARGVKRPVTLLFGAREQRDLYALDELETIAQRWQGRFRFVPVLSAEAADSDWNGARGLVTEQLAELLEPNSHAYLCGPVAMIDSAVELLAAQGVTRAHIHFDKFTTLADAAAAVRVQATFTDYLKYFTFHLVGLLAIIALIVGERFVTGGLLAVLALYMLGDAYLGDDKSTPQFQRPGLLTVQLWMALPLICMITFTAVWTMCAGDPFGFGAGISALVGYDVVAWRDHTVYGHISGWILTGLMIGMIGTITAHELTHRTWDPVSMLIGRWLLAFSFDTSFAIEHVYGHHRYVSTVEDPATAPRGRNAYHHVVASTIKGNISAWKIERERLQKKRLPTISVHNAVLRGYAMSATLVAASYALGGLRAMAFFIACALWGKGLLEIVNYMEHYGIVRNPQTPVQPRHSWNTNKRISSWSMFNLTRHSHHHAQGEVPYQDLRPYPEAPMMINGYLTTIAIAMIPPLWHRLMTPKVLAWDRDYASGEELELAAVANERSGIAALQKAGSLRPEPLISLGA